MEKYIGQVEINGGAYDWEILTIIKKNNFFIAGFVTNAGLTEEFKWMIDTDFSDDENLQQMINLIQE